MIKKQRFKNLITIICSVVILSFFGCAPVAKYGLMINQPTENTYSFKVVEVNKVEVGVTTDEVSPETLIDLRSFIIEEIKKKKIYQQVVEEYDLTNGAEVIQIDTKITDFKKGSRFLRSLLGIFGAGIATLDAQCRFINKDTNKVFADGTFIAELTVGFFGGAANPTEMSKQVARAVAKFLNKGE